VGTPLDRGAPAVEDDGVETVPGDEDARRTARRPAPDVYVLPEDDPFGDAFRVRRTGRSVRIVNGPTVAALDGIGGDDRATVRDGG